MNGEVFDILTHSDGSQEMFYLGENLIVNGAYFLIAALLKQHAGIGGITHMDFGNGDASWDVDLTIPALVKTIDVLFGTKVVHIPTTIVFISDVGTETTAVTRKIELRATVTDTDMTDGTIQPIREIGCRGGNADPTAASSYLFNFKIVRPLYQLTTSESLERRFRITI
jgi:hypothetical protein